MSTERTVSIIAPADGRKNYVANDVPVSKLANYSSFARYRYLHDADTKKPYGESDKRNTSNSREFDLGEGMDEHLARTVAVFTKNSDLDKPAPLTLELFGKDRSLKELVQIWRIIGHGYKVPRERHGDSIREDLRLKLYATTPFTFADFKLVVENLKFDRGVVHSALDRLSFLHIKGYLEDTTKTEVENYCKAHEGLWDSLLETVGRVDSKINEAAAQKAAREKAREARDRAKERQKERKTAEKSGVDTKVKTVKSGGNGKDASAKGKAKAKKPVEPFVRKEDDFPPLA